VLTILGGARRVVDHTRLAIDQFDEPSDLIVTAPTGAKSVTATIDGNPVRFGGPNWLIPPRAFVTSGAAQYSGHLAHGSVVAGQRYHIVVTACNTSQCQTVSKTLTPGNSVVLPPRADAIDPGSAGTAKPS
jgi:hypothetical protein